MFVDIFFPFRLILKGILFLDLQEQLVRCRQGWGVSDSRVFSSVGTVKYGISQEKTLFFVRCVGAWSLTWFCNFTFLRPLLPPFILSSSLQETSPPVPDTVHSSHSPLQSHSDFPLMIPWAALWCTGVRRQHPHHSCWGPCVLALCTATARPLPLSLYHIVSTWLCLHRNSDAGSSFP